MHGAGWMCVLNHTFIIVGCLKCSPKHISFHYNVFSTLIMVVLFSRLSELDNSAHKFKMNNILTCHICLLYGIKNDPNNEMEGAWVYCMVNIYFCEYVSSL